MIVAQSNLSMKQVLKESILRVGRKTGGYGQDVLEISTQAVRQDLEMICGM